MNTPAPKIQILVISLKRSPGRREKVIRELSPLSLPWSFLDAEDGSLMKTFPLEYKPSKVMRLQGYALTANEIGCYLSHKKAWQRCVDANLPTLILEDDFTLADNFQYQLIDILENADQWNFLRLQGLYDVPHTKIIQIGSISIAKNIGDAVGATAYLLKPSIAKKLIESSHEIYEPVDHFLEHYHKHHLEYLAIRPYLVDITRAQSTIDDRPERRPIKGLLKIKRSIYRILDRCFNSDPWYPR